MRATVIQRKTKRPVPFELLEPARTSLLAWLERRGGAIYDYAFPSRIDHDNHVSTRQYSRLVDEWVTAIGPRREEYGTHSLRRTKASIIYRATGKLRAVQILLGHTKFESTVRYLCVDVEDALPLAESTKVEGLQRSFRNDYGWSLRATGATIGNIKLGWFGERALTAALPTLPRETGRSALVKSFGRRQAYESPRGRNPRATTEGYGDFDLGLVSAMAQSPQGSAAIHADRPLRCASAWLCRSRARIIADLSAWMIAMDTCRSVADG